MATHPERLEKYRDFVDKHSTNGVYDPEKGLGGLLSTLTPDPKPVVLAGMQLETVYFTRRQLYRDVLTWLENTGISRNIFPITTTGSWNYCETIINNEQVDGSLVKVGAVVKQAHLGSPEGDETGYIKSQVGQELAVPLLPYACEFVDIARRRAEQNTYDSMWRILGSIASINDRRRPSAVFKIIKFLIDNPGVHRMTDIGNELKGQIRYETVSIF